MKGNKKKLLSKLLYILEVASNQGESATRTSKGTSAPTFSSGSLLISHLPIVNYLSINVANYYLMIRCCIFEFVIFTSLQG